MTSEQIDSIFDAMDEYERKNLGIKYGAEFPEIAHALMDSTKFKSAVDGIAVLGLFTALTIPTGNEFTKERAKEFLKDTPMRSPLAGIFYAGYKLGIATAEIKNLEIINDKETK